jgi:hypothetical protein
MNQYFPAYLCVPNAAFGTDASSGVDPLLGCKVTEEEYLAALYALSAAGLQSGCVQECD